MESFRRDRLNDMSDDAITKAKTVRVRLDPANPPPKSDWSEVDKLTEEEIHAAALSDPDAQPWTPEQLARTFHHADLGLVPLHKNIALYAWHGRHHVAQITGLRERMKW